MRFEIYFENYKAKHHTHLEVQKAILVIASWWKCKVYLGTSIYLFQIWPPKWFPGDVMEDTVEFSDVDVALDDVMRAGSLLQDR